MRDFVIAALCLLMAAGCASGPGRASTDDTADIKPFTAPQIPDYLTNPEDRAGYMVMHYWDNFDFADTAAVTNEEWKAMAEQAFVDYIDIFPYVSLETVGRGAGSLLDRTLEGSREMYHHFTELFEKYLYEPNSPFRQEDFYIAVLGHIVASERLEDIDKLRARSHLEMAMKNRPGEVAADFEYTLADGSRGRLGSVRAGNIILFFNNPDCPDCRRVKEILSQLDREDVKIVAIYPDEDIELWRAADYPAGWINGYNASSLSRESLYDLKAIPTLYLLDGRRRVVLKDAPVEAIMEYLSR